MPGIDKTHSWKTLLNIAIRIFIPFFFFFYVFYVIDIKDIVLAFRKIEWKWFYLGSASIFLLNILCALRTKELMLNEERSLVKLWSIHSVSAFIAGLLPLRTGEVSFAYLLRKYCIVTGSKALAILLSVRYLEYIFFLILIFFLSVVGVFVSPSKLNIAVYLMISLNLIIILLITWKADWAFKIIKKIIEISFKFFLSTIKSESIISKIEKFTKNMQSIFAISISKKLLLLTLLIVLLRQAFILLMLRSMGAIISMWLVIFLFAFLYAAKFVQGFGSFGSQESGIAAALILVGYKQSESLVIAVGTHLLQWTPILLFGFIGYILIFKQLISSGVTNDKSTLKSLY